MSTRGDASGAKIRVPMLRRALVGRKVSGETKERRTREIPGQVYHRLAERERAGWGQRNSLLDENSDQVDRADLIEEISISHDVFAGMLSHSGRARGFWCLHVRSPMTSFPVTFGKLHRRPLASVPFLLLQPPPT